MGLLDNLKDWANSKSTLGCYNRIYRKLIANFGQSSEMPVLAIALTYACYPKGYFENKKAQEILQRIIDLIPEPCNPQIACKAVEFWLDKSQLSFPEAFWQIYGLDPNNFIICFSRGLGELAKLAAEIKDINKQSEFIVSYINEKGLPPSEAKKSIDKDIKAEEQEYKGKKNIQNLTAYNELTEIQKKAETGDIEAQTTLGWMYFEGKGLTQDFMQAFKWLIKAAEQGYADAQNKLGLMYYEGKGISQNYNEAIKFYTKAAEQGLAKAQYNIGVMFYNAVGVIKDHQEAFKWYTKAAEQGYAPAQYYLSWMYYKGEGIIQDFVQTYKWAILASKNATEKELKKNSISLQDNIQRKLTHDQIAEAQKLSQEWIENHSSSDKNKLIRDKNENTSKTEIKADGSIEENLIPISSNKDHSVSFSMLYLAYEKFRNGNKEEAFSDIESILQLDPDLAYANIVRGEFAVTQENWFDAQRYLEKGLNLLNQPNQPISPEFSNKITFEEMAGNGFSFLGYTYIKLAQKYNSIADNSNEQKFLELSKQALQTSLELKPDKNATELAQNLLKKFS